jgi:hypothetical protein
MGRAEDLMQRLEAGGVAYLDALIAEAKHEELFLDFKRSEDHGQGRSLHANDWKHLRKAVSGFANAEGGVIVWGVGSDKSSGRDVPTRGPGLSDCRRFAALIDDAVSGCTVPPVPSVRSAPIARDDGVSGYVATLVPSSPNAPHQSLHEDHYFIRLGSSFRPVPHAILAGLFGRQPRPSVDTVFLLHPAEPGVDGGSRRAQVKAWAGLMIQNFGSVVASDVYVSWRIAKMGGENCKVIAYDQTEQRFQLDGIHRLGACLAVQGNRFAPGATQCPVELRFNLQPPFTEGIDVEIRTGCAGAPPILRRWEVSASDLQDHFEDAHTRKNNERESGAPIDWHKVTTRILGIPPEETTR